MHITVYKDHCHMCNMLPFGCLTQIYHKALVIKKNNKRQFLYRWRGLGLKVGCGGREVRVVWEIQFALNLK